MSGQDILDQAAGTTAFVHDYLHVDWDGTEAQNDKATNAVHGVTGNPVTDGIGSVPLDHSGPRARTSRTRSRRSRRRHAGVHRRQRRSTDALTVADGGYKVVFLAFPFEAYGTASDKADLMNRTFSFFG